MMKSTELYDFAKEKDILIINDKVKKSPSMSMMEEGLCTIVIDNKQIHSSVEENVITAHEVGHCETGAFYDENSLELRSRMEHRANRWAIKKLIPKDELIEAFENNILETWNLAEHFEVTEEFMIKALEFYGYYHRAI